MPRTLFAFLLILILCSTAFAQTAEDKSSKTQLLEYLQNHEGDQWFGLYFSGGKVGYLRHGVKLLEGGLLVETGEDVAFRLQVMGQLQEVNTDNVRTYRLSDGALVSLRSSMKSAGSESSFELAIENGKYFLTSRIGGKAEKVEIAYQPENLYEIYAAELAITSGVAALGYKMQAYSFDPSIARRLTSQTEVVALEKRMFRGVKVDTVRIEGQVIELSLPQTSWYDADGNLLEVKVAGFITALWESEGQVRSGEYLADFLGSSIVKAPGSLKKQARADRLLIEFAGIASEDLLLENHRQHWIKSKDGALRLEVTKEKLSKKHPWPLSKTEVKKMGEFLKPESRIQSDDPRLKKLARKIVKGSQSVEEAAGRLMMWVYKNLDKKYTPMFANALDVLELREGDCGEHAVLMVALARAAGIPAREQVGIVHAAEIGGFGFHAWTEIWAGRWISLDPSWNEMPVDVSHIAFAKGGMQEQFKVAALIGRLKILMVELR